MDWVKLPIRIVLYAGGYLRTCPSGSEVYTPPID